MIYYLVMREFEDKFIKVVNMYNKLENLKIEFVPGIKVSHLDAHLLALMNNNPHKKVSELAELFGVTKGAVSQQIKKMEKRDLLKRVRHNDNYREVYIELTDNGKKAVESHTKFHDIIFSEFVNGIENLNNEKKVFINMVLDNLSELFCKAEDILQKGL